MRRCRTSLVVDGGMHGRIRNVMLRLCGAGLAALLSSIAPALAIGPSFDCSKVHTPLAQFICADPDLSKTDLEFVRSYYALRQQVGPSGWQAAKQEAIDFQNAVAQQCGIDQSGNLPINKATLTQCLQNAYKRQTSIWVSRLSGFALEEATRPIEQHVGLQARLQAIGLLSLTETIDGVYGAGTRAAIESWQRSAGLPVTGFLGNADATKLAGSAVAADGSSTYPATPWIPVPKAALIPISELAAIYERARQ